jgi:putative hemolysin
MGALLACSAFFSGAETALFSLSRKQVKELAGRSPFMERLLMLLHADPSGLLISLLFGNLVVNVLFFSTSATLAIALGESFGGWVESGFGLLVLVAVIFCGEILPKAAGISFPEKLVRLSAIPLQLWYRVMGPLRVVLKKLADRMEPAAAASAGITADELKMLVGATEHDDSFGRQEKAIVEEIVKLPEIRVREIMVHRVDQLFVHADLSCSEALRRAVEASARCVPVYEGEEDHLIGQVSVRRLFGVEHPERAVRGWVEPIHYVPETKRADAMLREFMEEGYELVCVVDEYGGVAGLLSQEHLLEEVVGDFDATEVPPIEQLGETTYRLGGQLSIREWRNLFVGFVSDEMMRALALDTVSGLVISLLKRMPVAGDVAYMRNLSFTVEQVRNNRIVSVLLKLSEEEAST